MRTIRSRAAVLALSCIAPALHAGAAAGEGPAAPFALWRLSEIVGVTAVEDVGGLDGVYLGGATLGAAGPLDPCGDTAVLLDGSNDSVFVSGVGDALDIGDDSFTVTARFRKTSDDTRFMKIVNKGMTTSGSPPNAGYQLRIRDSIIEFSVSPGGVFETVSAPEPPVNAWHFAAGVFDRDAGMLRLFVDPTDAGADAELAVDPVGPIGTNIDFSIGSLNRTPVGVVTEHFHGLIDEVRLYRVALTGEQVLALATPPAPCLADLAPPQGLLDLADVLAFISAFQSGEPAADLSGPCGTFDLADVNAFVNEFLLGCD